jgi:uncharacterized membrane protein YqjE
MDRSLPCAEGELTWSGDRLALVRGRREVFAVPLAEIRAVAVEEAKAFRRPWLGLAFALLLLVACGWGVLTALQAAPGMLVGHVGVALLFGAAFGLWVLYEVLNSPRICWLRLTTARARPRLALPGVSRQQVEEFAEALQQAVRTRDLRE